MNVATDQPSRLFYFLDPMCSWCWAFRPALELVKQNLPTGITLIHVMGGLAPDTEEPMPKAMREKLKDIWRTIQVKVPGTEFNVDYWNVCTP
ncbi:MAG: DsbA family protein, partial [Methylococcus sp.]